MQNKSSNPAIHSSKGLSLGMSVTIAATVSIILAVAGTFWVKNQLGGDGFTTDTSRNQFVVGNDVMQIPLNLIRFAHHRDGTAHDKIDLALHWPSGKGYSTENSSFFNNAAGMADIVFITLTKQELQLDMSRRLEPIYSKLFDGPGVLGPADLTFQALKPGAGYDGEMLAIFGAGNNAWAARCQIAESGATCLRDINMGESLSVRYRFSTDHLPEWRQLENFVVNAVEKLLEK